MIEPSARQAIEDLIHRHAWLIDQGRAEGVSDLYEDDARLFGIGPDKIGRSEIVEWAKARAAMVGRRSRHVQTNIVLDDQGNGVVSGTVVLTLYRHDGPGSGSSEPLLIGEYSDLYRAGADGIWRFAERRLIVLFGEG